jgi:glycosyltransferase involved in cell wall biosynthesis
MEVALPQEPPLPRVSFVIPTWNQRTLLAECLSSIVETTKGIA